MRSRIKAILLSVLTLTGCAKENFPEVDLVGRIPLNISSKINQVSTKATSDGFVDNDEIGLFAVNYTNGNTAPGTLLDQGNQADNVKYVFNESEYRWVPVRGVYYKDAETNVDIYLYYPYQKSITNVASANFEVQKDQSAAATSSTLSGYEASDFLWGKATNVTPTENKISVPLSHRLSSVNVTLQEVESNSGFSAGEFDAFEKSVIINNTTRKATINYATGEVTPLGSPQMDGIVMSAQDNNTFRGIVVPQSVAAGAKLFTITIDGVSYSFSINDSEICYQPGMQSNFTIGIKKKVSSGQYELSLIDSQISEWKEDKNVHGGEARQYYVVNVSTPGTLKDVIEADGKDPAKIKNIKVSGTINDMDFDYMRNEMTEIQSVNLKEVTLDCFNQDYCYLSAYFFDDYDAINNVSREALINQYGEPDRIYQLVGGDEYGEYAYWYSEEGRHSACIPNGAFGYVETLMHFDFPEKVQRIGDRAFGGTYLVGALIIPDEVTYIGINSFSSTRITSVSFPQALKTIERGAFSHCLYLSGSLLLPYGLEKVGKDAFSECSFNGRLELPETLFEIGESSFWRMGSIVGGLTIPEKIKEIPGGCFYGTRFSGSLNLNNVISIGESAFEDCGFEGELVLSDEIKTIPVRGFSGNGFSHVSLPSELKKIGELAFWGSRRLTGDIVFPEGLVEIGNGAFANCSNITGLSFPSTLQSLGSSSFYGCFNVSKIECSAIEPPQLLFSAFDGIAKDNFSLSVPEQSIVRYSTSSGWSDFRRIRGLYDFTVSRNKIRVLNESEDRTLTLRAPSGLDWSIESKPEWLSVTPSSGTGKMDIIVSIDEMPRTSETFEINAGTFLYPDYINYRGRSGDIVFKLNDKDVTFTLAVEQYDSDYSDGQVITYHEASRGPGIDIVFIGDGYDAKDIVDGKFLEDSQNGFGHFFDIEPYKTYKEYFNVYAVISKSHDSGIGTVNSVVDTKFGSYLSDRILNPSADECFKWAKKADSSMDLSKSLVIMLMNSPMYEGVTLMYSDGSAIACCPVSQAAYPYDFRGLIQHEAGGHGFGKLADEYIYHNSFIQNCPCPDGCPHPQSDDEIEFKQFGWYKNISMNTDNKSVPWADLIYHPKYSDKVDMFEGAYMHARGIYRSEATSCMNNNIPYYSAISRLAIVERIKECAGETFDFDEFVAKDSFEVGTKASGNGTDFDWTFGVDPNFNLGNEHGSVVFMGDHPNVK